MTSLGRETYPREGEQMTANDELHAILALEADPPGAGLARSPYSTAQSESKGDEGQLLEG